MARKLLSPSVPSGRQAEDVALILLYLLPRFVRHDSVSPMMFDAPLERLRHRERYRVRHHLQDAHRAMGFRKGRTQTRRPGQEHSLRLAAARPGVIRDVDIFVRAGATPPFRTLDFKIPSPLPIAFTLRRTNCWWNSAKTRRSSARVRSGVPDPSKLLIARDCLPQFQRGRYLARDLGHGLDGARQGKTLKVAVV